MLPAADRSRGCGGPLSKMSRAWTALPSSLPLQCLYIPSPGGKLFLVAIQKHFSVSETAQLDAIRHWPAVTVPRKSSSWKAVAVVVLLLRTTPSFCHHPLRREIRVIRTDTLDTTYFSILLSSIDDSIEIAGHHVWSSRFGIKQQLFQRQASRRKRSGPIPHGQSHACPGVEMRETIAGLMLLLCRTTRWLGPPIASNPFTVRQADCRTSLLLAGLLGCLRLSAVWPDRAIEMILNHVQ